MNFLSDLFLVAAVGVLLWIGWRDFCTLKITNRLVLILLGIYLCYAATRGFADFRTDAIAGGALFGVTFIFWLFGAIGAGDVKLYLPVGLFVGLYGLMPYAVALTVFSLILLAAIKIWGRFTPGRSFLGRRLKELREGGKVPYGVPMGLGASAVIAADRFMMI